MDKDGALRTLAEQLGRVRKELDGLEAELSVVDREYAFQGISAERIRAILQAHRRRETIFGSRLFSDHGWDILLALYAAALSDEKPNITEMCKAADVELTTSLRWLGVLEKADLVVRSSDSRDRRSVRLQLSRRGRELMNQYFAKGHFGEFLT